MIRSVLLALLLIAAPAHAASIWSSTPVTPSSTDRIPVDVSAVGAPSHVTPLTMKAYMETGGTVTASDPVLDLTQTWNNGAVMFTAEKTNVTNTASAAGSLLRDWQVDGVSKATVAKTGAIKSHWAGATATPSIMLQTPAGIEVGFWSGASGAASNLALSSSVTSFTNSSATVGISTGIGIGLGADAYLDWRSSTNMFGAADVQLRREAANTLAQRNGANAQTFRVYDTYTDASNYARIALNTNLTGDWVQVAAESAGTPGLNRSIAVSPLGTGAISAHVPDSAGAGGNARGANAVDWQTSRGGPSQAATGANSVISGGLNNTASATYATVAGGAVNNAVGRGTAIGGGENNTATQNQGTIAGGFGNSNTGLQATIGGGLNNATSATKATICGGESNIASGISASVLGGRLNSATNAYATVAGGDGNTASSTYSTVAGGRGNTALGTNSWIPGGYQATTRGLESAGAYSSGQRAAQGDAQVILQPVRQTTSATSLATLTTDAAAESATNVMVLPVNSGAFCKGMLTATHAAGAAVGGWDISVTARRGASGNATVQTATITLIGADAAIGAPTIGVAALTGAGAGAIAIQTTPANATTTYWVAELKCVQAA